MSPWWLIRYLKKFHFGVTLDAPVNCGIRIQKEIIDDIQTGASETVTQHTTQLQEVHKIKTLKCKHTIMDYGTDDPSETSEPNIK